MTVCVGVPLKCHRGNVPVISLLQLSLHTANHAFGVEITAQYSSVALGFRVLDV